MTCDVMPPLSTLNIFKEDRCDLPSGHVDAHRARDHDGFPWRWQHDPECTWSLCHFEDEGTCVNLLMWPEDGPEDRDPFPEPTDPTPTRPELIDA